MLRGAHRRLAVERRIVLDGGAESRAALSGMGVMAITADRKGSREADRDDAADASRFFSRIGYLVLAIGAPVGVVLHPLGLFVMFSIGVGLILMAAALDAEPGFFERLMRPFYVPAFLALLAGLVWATLSILWTPYPLAAAQSCSSWRPARCDGAGGGGAARERERHRPLPFPDRRGRSAWRR